MATDRPTDSWEMDSTPASSRAWVRVASVGRQGGREAGGDRHTSYHAHTPMPPAPNMSPELLARPN